MTAPARDVLRGPFFPRRLAAMKKLLAAAVVLVVAFGAVAWWQEWFKFEKNKTDDGKTHVGIAINKEKFQKDRDKLKKATADRSKGLKDQLAHWRDKAKGLTGAEKEKADKKIDALTKQHEALESKMKDLDGVSEDKFEALKKDVEGALQETDKDENK
jgi:hypothetical protein